MKEFKQTIIDVLVALGYSDAYVIDDLDSTYYTFKFSTHNGGSDYMAKNHMKVIDSLCDGNLIEFYYQNDTQFIYVRKPE